MQHAKVYLIFVSARTSIYVEEGKFENDVKNFNFNLNNFWEKNLNI